MISYCNRRLYKGNSYEICLPITDTGVTSVRFYTSGDIVIEKEGKIVDDTMCFELTKLELDLLPDGVLRYSYADFDSNTKYVVVTPGDYSGSTLEDIIADAFESGHTAGEEEQKAKLVSTAITENGTYTSEDGFSQVDVNVVKPEIYFPMNPKTVGAGSSKGNFFPIFVTGCTIDPTNYTLKAVGDVISNISDLQINNGMYFVNVDITANPTDKTRVGYIQGAFTDTDGVMHSVKPCVVNQKPGTENQDYNSGYTAGYDDGKQDLVANIQGDYFVIPEGTTKIRRHAFEDACFSTITIPSSVTLIDDFAFAGNTCLKEIVIPSSVQTVGGLIFGFCQKLTAATFENSAITSFGTDMFDGCGALKEVKLPDALTSLPDGTFSSCGSLETITIPSGVTSLGNNCFQSCKSLKTITIPASVTNIGRDCFSSISGMTYMRFEGTTPPELDSFDGFNASLGSSGYTWPIYVPCEAVEAYRTAWPIYAHRISCQEEPEQEATTNT